MNFTPFRLLSPTPWTGASFTFVAGFIAKTQDPSSFAPQFEGFTVPALPNSSTNHNGRLLCPVRVVRCYLDHTAAHCLRCEGCLSPRDVARRRSLRTRSPCGSGRRYLRRTSYRQVRSGPSSEGQRDPGFHSFSSVQEELRCRPGVESRYLAQAHHLHAFIT